MREKFELASKIVGLVFFCWGIFVFLGVIIFLALKPDYIQMLSQVTNSAYDQKMVNDLREVSSNTMMRYALIVVFISVIQMLIGSYLMRSNNLFVMLCYSFKDQDAHQLLHDIELNVKSSEGPGKPEEPSEDKYAPPGYFK